MELTVTRIEQGVYTKHNSWSMGSKSHASGNSKGDKVPVEKSLSAWEDLGYNSNSYVSLGLESVLCGSRLRMLPCVKNSGHLFAKRLYCGREWCARCGKDKSDMHKRRYMRILPKLFSYETAGYFVFTMPLNIRECFEKKESLQAAGKFVSKMLKSMGFERGIRRWHTFGSGAIIEGELDLGVYHPHLNVLVDHEKIKPSQLKEIKLAWGKWLEDFTERELKTAKGKVLKMPVVNYGWYDWKGGMRKGRKYVGPWKFFHFAKYITRPTFKTLNWYEALANELFNLANICYWGKFDKVKGAARVEQFFKDMEEHEGREKPKSAELIKVSQGDCVECGSKLRADSLETFEDIKHAIKKDFGMGYYQVDPSLMYRSKPVAQQPQNSNRSDRTKLCRGCRQLHDSGKPCDFYKNN